MEAGLSSQEAAARLNKNGPNEPAPAHRRAGLLQFAAYFANPLVIILLVASAVSAAVGEIVNATLIAVIVLLSVALNAFQTYQSDRAVEELRQDVAPKATALRDGEWREVLRRELVTGDIIRLRGGDLVPADATLIESVGLRVQQAALTGESLPVEKTASPEGAGQGKKESSEDGSVEASAADDPYRVFLGTSVVSGTAIAVVTATGPRTSFGDIAAMLAKKAPETEFERGSRRFGMLIMQTVVFLVLFVLLVNLAFHHDRKPLDALLFAVALAVGLTPEFLPMIVSVTLAKGAVRMARQKVIVKHLAALQNFGSIDILCSDKTGTLTSGEMALDQHVDIEGKPSDRVFLLSYLNCLRGAAPPGHEGDDDPAFGVVDPLDAAILRHSAPDVAGYMRIAEIPFDFERRRVSVVIERDRHRQLVTKGAPESVLACCTAHETGGTVKPLDDEARARFTALYNRFSGDGLRVVAVAVGKTPEKPEYGPPDEADLTLAGLLAFSDPPLDDADEMLAALRNDGVHIKILTGDGELVARNVCSRVGLDVKRILLGDEIDKMSDAALAFIANRTTVFARVSPAQKNRIILALKSRHHVVGFLGDGINDAPPLHTADVGISVSSGTEVAKDAADIILMERGLEVLHGGILEGRRAFGNVMKYLLMGTSSNFGNMFSMAGASLFLPYLPMLPTQILLNNFLYDLAQVTIPTDNVDDSFVRKPRRWDIRVIKQFMFFIGPISSIYDFLTFWVLLSYFHAKEQEFHTGWFVESLATQTLVLFVIRTAGNPFRSRPSLPLAITTLAVVAVGVLLPYTLPGKLMGFVSLPAAFFAFLLVATVTYLALVELVKRRLMRTHHA